MKLRRWHWAAFGALVYSGLFVVTVLFGMAFEDRYAQGWALLQYRDRIPWWELALHPLLFHVLLFPLGLIVNEQYGPGLLAWIFVPAQGALLGWLLGRKKTDARGALSKVLFRAAFVVLGLCACGVTLVLSSKLDEVKREKERVARVVQMLDLAKYWLRGKAIDPQKVPSGYEATPIEDAPPYRKNGASKLLRLSAPAPPRSNALRSAPHFSDVVLDGFSALYVDERGRFVDLEWSKP